MSDQQFDPSSSEPVVPRSAVTVAALRKAVERLDEERTAVFDEEFARSRGDAVATSVFLSRWSMWVERYRVPATAARIHELELAMGAAATDEEARAVATEMSELLYKVTDGLVLP
ncbi:hypothetical protein GCM10010277_69790 [Streptomyces longisporoflavus]|uniref:hypothetical protein n=1 Tax=Streptomyces longisporoflavus TaxID=28044 RepID=UPI00167C8998|nr:hypothetical protein [Streptomyces longisporoflavus]GGV63605.1 hypothetical protein GCM10010277_69790 [Streptomyces longisporoflavus]